MSIVAASPSSVAMIRPISSSVAARTRRSPKARSWSTTTKPSAPSTPMTTPLPVTWRNAKPMLTSSSAISISLVPCRVSSCRSCTWTATRPSSCWTIAMPPTAIPASSGPTKPTWRPLVEYATATISKRSFICVRWR
jgi:hypothetical protein